jgi:2'-hydroxyisoflavone reductase
MWHLTQTDRMRLLVLGGSWFLGRAVVEQALCDGWDVTVFRRGTGDPSDGTGLGRCGGHLVRGDRADPRDLARLTETGPWDGVLDACGYVPANVRTVAAALEPVSARMVFVSTVSDWPAQPVTETSPLLDCRPDAKSWDGGVGVPGGGRYGRFKAGCERAVLEVFGPERTTILRPGVLLGPREYAGRTRWWCERLERGGRVIAPGRPGRRIQPVDVRDAARFALALLRTETSGVFNVAGPGNVTFADYLHACRAATGSDAQLAWIGDDFLQTAGVRQWIELPLWRTHRGTWAVNAARARAHGLTIRPLAETVLDYWHWQRSAEAAPGHERARGYGLAEERETAVLRAWDEHHKRFPRRRRGASGPPRGC